jgi:hypothetical protein
LAASSRKQTILTGAVIALVLYSATASVIAEVSSSSLTQAESSLSSQQAQINSLYRALQNESYSSELLNASFSNVVNGVERKVEANQTTFFLSPNETRLALSFNVTVGSVLAIFQNYGEICVGIVNYSTNSVPVLIFNSNKECVASQNIWELEMPVEPGGVNVTLAGNPYSASGANLTVFYYF